MNEHVTNKIDPISQKDIDDTCSVHWVQNGKIFAMNYDSII